MRGINFTVLSLFLIFLLLAVAHAQDDDTSNFISKFPLTASSVSGYNLESTGTLGATDTVSPSGFGIGSGGSPANYTSSDDDEPSAGDVLRIGVGVLVGGLIVALGGMR